MEDRHHASEPETSPARRALSDDPASSLPSPAEDGGHSGSIRKGCEPFAQSQRGQLQNRRARINQQINKEMRMRAGAENLFRATTNAKVKETVALELSYVNSSLQLLKEELEDLNSNVEVYQTESEAAKAPMIPLGLKETKEADFTAPIQDFICQHYGEDGSLYREEIRELMDLRQAMRTPSRNQTGLDLLMEYYNQLYYLDQRFFPPHSNLGVHFHWYDSLTGVPSCQRALAFEKGSVLFNLGALYTQIGARQDRTTAAGIQRAIDAFQRAAGALNYLKENFSNAPSLDMSGPALCMLVRLMVAQVQECAFESLALALALGGARDGDAAPISSLRLAQEAAQVSDVYLLVQQSMSQPLMKDYVPFSWTSMVQVKVEHFRALCHHFAAVALCGRALSEDVSEEAEKAFLHFYVGARAGPPLGRLLRDSQQRRKLGKAHLRHAVMRHEEAMRLHGVCKSFRKMDILQDVLAATHKRSLDMYSELDREDDFDPTLEAPEIRSQSRRKPDVAPPDFAAVRVADIFRRLVRTEAFGPRARAAASNDADSCALCVGGALVGVLRARPPGAGAFHLPAENGGRPRPHAARRLACPGGGCGGRRLRGGGGTAGRRLHRVSRRPGLQVGEACRGGGLASEPRRQRSSGRRGRAPLARRSGREKGRGSRSRPRQRERRPEADVSLGQRTRPGLITQLEQEEEGRRPHLSPTGKRAQFALWRHGGHVLRRTGLRRSHSGPPGYGSRARMDGTEKRRLETATSRSSSSFQRPADQKPPASTFDAYGMPNKSDRECGENSRLK